MGLTRRTRMYRHVETTERQLKVHRCVQETDGGLGPCTAGSGHVGTGDDREGRLRIWGLAWSLSVRTLAASGGTCWYFFSHLPPSETTCRRGRNEMPFRGVW